MEDVKRSLKKSELAEDLDGAYDLIRQLDDQIFEMYQKEQARQKSWFLGDSFLKRSFAVLGYCTVAYMMGCLFFYLTHFKWNY